MIVEPKDSLFVQFPTHKTQLVKYIELIKLHRTSTNIAVEHFCDKVVIYEA